MDIPGIQFFKWDSFPLKNLYMICLDSVGIFWQAKNRDTAFRQFYKAIGIVLFWDLNVDHESFVMSSVRNVKPGISRVCQWMRAWVSEDRNPARVRRPAVFTFSGSLQVVYSRVICCFITFSSISNVSWSFINPSTWLQSRSRRLSMRANPFRISLIIAVWLALRDRRPLSTAARRDSIVFVRGSRAIKM